MESRRSFLKASAAAAVVSRSVLGANDRIQMAIIGTGERGEQVHRAFTWHKDQVFVAACDVVRRCAPTAARTGHRGEELQGAAELSNRHQRASGRFHRGPHPQFPGLHQIPAAARRSHRYRVPFVAALHPRSDVDSPRPYVCVGREDADAQSGLIRRWAVSLRR